MGLINVCSIKNEFYIKVFGYSIFPIFYFGKILRILRFQQLEQQTTKQLHLQILICLT